VKEVHHLCLELSSQGLLLERNVKVSSLWQQPLCPSQKLSPALFTNELMNYVTKILFFLLIAGDVENKTNSTASIQATTTPVENGSTSFSMSAPLVMLLCTIMAVTVDFWSY